MPRKSKKQKNDIKIEDITPEIVKEVNKTEDPVILVEPKKQGLTKFESVYKNTILTLIVLLLCFAFAYVLNGSFDELNKKTNETFISFSVKPALCSQSCVESESNLDIRSDISKYINTGHISVLKEPYIKDLQCYDLQNVQNKNCCVEYTLKNE